MFNLKQMAQTLNYLSEHGLLDYTDLETKTAEATARYNALSGKIKAAEKRMAEIAVLRTHIVNYAKTRETYVAYRKAGYSRKLDVYKRQVWACWTACPMDCSNVSNGNFIVYPILPISHS